MIILFSSSQQQNAVSMAGLHVHAKDVCRDHQIAHKSKHTRCHLKCIMDAVNLALKDDVSEDVTFQCEACRLIFDDFASAHFHVC